MPKYENKCPKHNELDIYNHCSYNCIYCISLSKELTIRFDIEDEMSKIKKMDPDCNPFYLSPWTDCYQHEEADKGYTREILSLLSEKNIPFFVITKSPLILRDVDLFRGKDNAFIAISINNLNDVLTKQLEPDASTASERKQLITELVQLGDVKTVVKIDPIIPGITDEEELNELIDWLCVIKPGAITVETFRISGKILENMKLHLPASLIQKMLNYYLEISDEPVHPFIDYRLEMFKRIAARLQIENIKVSFCKASLPEKITEYDCRGGYNYDF